MKVGHIENSLLCWCLFTDFNQHTDWLLRLLNFCEDFLLLRFWGFKLWTSESWVLYKRGYFLNFEKKSIIFVSFDTCFVFCLILCLFEVSCVFVSVFQSICQRFSHVHFKFMRMILLCMYLSVFYDKTTAFRSFFCFCKRNNNDVCL